MACKTNYLITIIFVTLLFGLPSISAEGSVNASLTTSIASSISLSTTSPPACAISPNGRNSSSLLVRRKPRIKRTELTGIGAGSQRCDFPMALAQPDYFKFGDWNKIIQKNQRSKPVAERIPYYFQEHIDTCGPNFNIEQTRQLPSLAEAKAADTPDTIGTIDHIWERSMLPNFLFSTLNSGFDCEDFKQLFFHTGCKQQDGGFLQQIMNQQPTAQERAFYSGLAAMTQGVNEYKGGMFENEGRGTYRVINGRTTVAQVLADLQRMTMVFDLFHKPEMIEFQTAHNEANNRIYQAFLSLDDYIAREQPRRSNGNDIIQAHFAESYKDWYQGVLGRIGPSAWTAAGVALTWLQANSPNDPGVAAWSASPKRSQNYFQIDQSHLTWDNTRGNRPWQPGGIQKRGVSFQHQSLCNVSFAQPTRSLSPSSPATSSQLDWPCRPSEDPAMEIDSAVCTCINGATIKPPSETTAPLCPWPTLPDEALAQQAAITAGNITSSRSGTIATGLSCAVTYPSTGWVNNDITASCTCNNGETRVLARSTTSPYVPCPPTSNVGSTATITSAPPYPFTFTETPGAGGTQSAETIVCEGQDIENFAGYEETLCSGSRRTYAPAPSSSLLATAEHGTSAYVGTLTGAALSSSVSSALNVACPSGPSATTCTAAVATVSGIDYPAGQDSDDSIHSNPQGLVEGTLVIQIGGAKFENGTMRDRMIEAAAGMANQTSFNKQACYNAHRYASPRPGGTLQQYDYDVCNMAGGMLLEYYTGLHSDGADDRLWLNFKFEGAEGDAGGDITAEVCKEAIEGFEVLAFFLSLFFPEVTPEVNTVGRYIVTGCEAAKEVENAVDSVSGGSGE